MGTRMIQLDDEAEATLSVLCNQTGLSISEVLKRGLQAYAALALKVTNSRNAVSRSLAVLIWDREAMPLPRPRT